MTRHGKGRNATMCRAQVTHPVDATSSANSRPVGAAAPEPVSERGTRSRVEGGEVQR
jgi:hypothetical protein